MSYNLSEIKGVEKIEMIACAAQKKYVAVKEGSRLYSMGTELFVKLAEESGALRRVGDKRILVNTSILNDYIETMFS